MAKPNEHSQPLQSKYNHIITYGQSLASAAEGWPALSVAPRYDNLMLGQSPRSAAFSGASFKPVGEAAHAAACRGAAEEQRGRGARCTKVGRRRTQENESVKSAR